jgi:hypothetical protein
VTERDEDNDRLLFKDADLPWPGEFPYDRLNRTLQDAGWPGLYPSSTGQRVSEAMFDLMTKGPVSREDRLAWDELRLLERRLLLDFLMYTFGCAGDDLWSDRLWDLPMPLLMPDFRRLADNEPDYDKVISLPSAFDAPTPSPMSIDSELSVFPAADIGPVSLNEEEILGDAYV